MARFIGRPSAQDLWRPMYGGIDWQQLKTNIAGTAMNAVYFLSDDGLEQQCTQENTKIRMSQLHDDSDAILVDDPRDETRFAFFRDMFIPETFQDSIDLLTSMGACTMRITAYPDETIFKLWQKNKIVELDELDTIPNGWLDLE